ncbi:uncharacterized protein LOC123549503 isoform X2 [Mercenaria mercenaria]|uniref:uncharacterized protein LOC123549503 isoform X2 n=1 Tax=Mercenaria mercenaria TaxID=6596 RepID=UPI00234F1CCE|nr:uncharacterized protein LOC123549503 isoform X2 [Mercenaria mercenaria]
MTARTPPPYSSINVGKEPKENKTENSDIIDYNGTLANKAGINQSPVGGNNSNTTAIENRPLNRGHRPFPSDNFGALFDIEYYHLPYTKKKEIKKEEPVKDANDTVAKEYQGENTTENRKDSELDMAYEGRRVEELEMRNKQHSAKIHELERELRNVKMESNRIKGQFSVQDGPYTNNGFTERGVSYDRSPERYQERPDYYPDPRYSEAQGNPRDQAPQDPAGRPQYKNEQHRITHRPGGADGESYWGFNKFYNPQYVTAYRREHIPFYAKAEEKEKHEQRAGGLYIIRFQDNDTAYEDVVVALRQLQPIIKSNFGYILGIARKHHVYPIEGDPGWLFSKAQQHRHPGIRIPCKNVEEAVAVFWFPNKDKAKAVFDNSFHNRFKDPCFPTPHSFEAYYIPLLTPPILSNLNTYLVIEVLNARRYYTEDLQDFQTKAGEAISQFTKTNLRFIASALEGRADFKPKTLFDGKSKVFISRFDSMVQLSELWETKTIQNILGGSGITGPRNVWAFSLQDWDDNM